MNYFLQGFFAFKGRMPRIPYFFFSLAVFVIIFVMSILFGLYQADDTTIWPETIGVLAICIFAGWSNLAITSKRLHDLGMSAWHMLWIFTPTLLPMILADYRIAVMSWVVGLITSLWLLFTPSSKNKFKFTK